MIDNRVKIIILAEGKQAAGEIKGLSGELDRLGGSAGKTSDLMKTALKFGGVAVALNELRQVGEALVETGTKTTQLQLAFKAITGSSQGAASELEFVRHTANSLGLEMMSLAEAYKGISAAARGTELEGQATRDIFLAVSQASASLGLSMDETKGSLLAISQMISKGKVSAEELRGQLGERLPGAFNLFAKALGVSTAALDEMLQKGEILATDALPKFAAALSGEYKNSAAAATETFQGKVNLLKNELSTLAASIWNGGMESALSAVVSGFTAATAAINSYINAGRDIDYSIPDIPAQDTGMDDFMATYKAGKWGPAESRRSYEGYSALSRSMASRRVRETASAVKLQADQLARYNAAKETSIALEKASTTALEKYRKQWQDLETVRKDIGEDAYWRQLGAATDQYEKATKAVKGHSGGVRAASAAHSEWNRVVEEGKRITESVLTPWEKYRQELERIEYYHQAGVISQETYTRALVKAGEQIGLVSDRQREFNQLRQVAQGYEAAYGQKVVETTGASDAGIRMGGAANLMASEQWEDHRNELTQTADAYKDLQRTIEGWGQKSAEAIVEFLHRTSGSFSDMVNSIVQDIERMLVYKGFTEPMFGAIGGAMGGIWEGLGGLFGLAHDGLVVGELPSAAKFVDPSIFATARRYHAGLNADEFPAILQRGEVVIPRQAVRQAGAGSAPPAVNIQIKNESGQPLSVESRQLKRTDSDGYILGVVLKASRTNDAFRRGLAGALPRR